MTGRRSRLVWRPRRVAAAVVVVAAVVAALVQAWTVPAAAASGFLLIGLSLCAAALITVPGIDRP